MVVWECCWQGDYLKGIGQQCGPTLLPGLLYHFGFLCVFPLDWLWTGINYKAQISGQLNWKKIYVPNQMTLFKYPTSHYTCKTSSFCVCHCVFGKRQCGGIPLSAWIWDNEQQQGFDHPYTSTSICMYGGVTGRISKQEILGSTRQDDDAWL